MSNISGSHFAKLTLKLEELQMKRFLVLLRLYLNSFFNNPQLDLAVHVMEFRMRAYTSRISNSEIVSEGCLNQFAKFLSYKVKRCLS